MSVPLKIVYLVKDGESGDNLIQTDSFDINNIDGTKIIDNSIPSSKLNSIDGEKIVDRSIPLDKLIRDFDLIFKIEKTPHSSLKLGMPVYWDGDKYLPSNANLANKIPTAIVREINEYDYTVQFSGTFSMSNDNWDKITGESGGLSLINNKYYLSNFEDGMISNISPIFSVPIYNCIKNDNLVSIAEVKFGILHSFPTNNSFSKERELFVGDGIKKNFMLNLIPYNHNHIMINIDGKILQNNQFSFIDKEIIFNNPPLDKSSIEITYTNKNDFSYANIVKHTEIVDYPKNIFYLPISVNSEKEIMVWVGGAYQDTSYSVDKNKITFKNIIDIGVKIQFVIFDSIRFTDLNHINRKTLIINMDSSKTLIDAFGSQSSARYEFHVMNNPLICGTIRLQETNPINVRLETYSSSVVPNMSTKNKLNVYINNDGYLEFKNLLNTSIVLVIERHQ